MTHANVSQTNQHVITSKQARPPRTGRWVEHCPSGTSRLATSKDKFLREITLHLRGKEQNGHVIAMDASAFEFRRFSFDGAIARPSMWNWLPDTNSRSPSQVRRMYVICTLCYKITTQPWPNVFRRLFPCCCISHRTLVGDNLLARWREVSRPPAFARKRWIFHDFLARLYVEKATSSGWLRSSGVRMRVHVRTSGGDDRFSEAARMRLSAGLLIVRPAVVQVDQTEATHAKRVRRTTRRNAHFGGRADGRKDGWLDEGLAKERVRGTVEADREYAAGRRGDGSYTAFAQLARIRALEILLSSTMQSCVSTMKLRHAAEPAVHGSANN